MGFRSGFGLAGLLDGHHLEEGRALSRAGEGLEVGGRRESVEA